MDGRRAPGYTAPVELPYDLTPWAVAALAGAAFVAGLVDAIAGGGGVITLPALLLAGLPTGVALGTNKGQSVFGSGAALASYWRAGLVRRRLARVTFPMGLLGAALGVALLLKLEEKVPFAVKPVVMTLLVAVAAFLAFRPRFGAGHREARTAVPSVAALLAFAVAAYDGFFGPGTGTFLILGFVALFGDSAREASADAKAINFASNLASCACFAALGRVEWAVALPMAAGQFAGATLGARITVRGSDTLVRRAVFVVVVATVAKLAMDLFR
ncbi:MAG: putative membrane transporter protein YfcA [Planctomycetes bacterium]|nr:putative membrane transporter protein YfcA [Planctomycetota bacterium]